MSDLIGRTLDHYRIVEKIGEGGMGVVYRAHDERLDRDVAIKVLPEEVAHSRDRIDRFEREARAVAKLDHPNILAIHDFRTDEGVTYAVMELLDGEDLAQRLKRVGRLTPAQWAPFLTQVASALLKYGPSHVATILFEMESWFSEHEYKSIQQGMGSLSQASSADPEAFERTNYMRSLVTYSSKR